MILERSREIFVKKGYAKVTMQDIVSVCGISRGGLYRYFSAPSEVFLAVFIEDEKQQKAVVEAALWEKRPAEEILMGLLKRLKADLGMTSSSLALATYEFFIENPEEQMIYRWQFDDLAELFREIIVYGIETEVFNEVEPAVWGRHLAYWISGLRLIAPVLSLADQRMDEEIGVMLAPLFRNKNLLHAIS